MITHNPGNTDNTSRIPHKRIVIASTALLIAVPSAGFAYQSQIDANTPAAAITIHQNSSEFTSQQTPVTISPVPESRTEEVPGDISSTTDVTVNGQHIDIPENGSITQSINTEEGTVEVQALGSGHASNSSSTSINISVQASSSTGKSNTRSTSNVNITQNR